MCRSEADDAAALVRRPKAVLSTLDSLKREDFAIGVIAVALGVELAQVTTQVWASDTEEVPEETPELHGYFDFICMHDTARAALSCATADCVR